MSSIRKGGNVHVESSFRSKAGSGPEKAVWPSYHRTAYLSIYRSPFILLGGLLSPVPLSGLTAFLSRFGYEGGILPQAVTIFWNIRLPRILSAVFIGASLSTAGAAYQGMFRNPLVSPDILGVSSGASLGAAFAILFGASNWLIQLSAFAGGTAAVAASYLISADPSIP
mgnify:CR=1 FL=1